MPDTPVKKKELHAMSDAEIVETIEKKRLRIFELRQQAVTEKLENNRLPGNIRRDIARLLTETRSRQLQKEGR